MNYKRVNIFFYFFICLISIAQAQTGKFFITNYSPVDYGAADQNWSTVQDIDGRVLVANLDGVLVNDGKSWKKITIRGNAIVYSLAKNNQNTIYVGGDKEFGYLLKNAKGKFIYQSLSQDLQKHELEFGNIWDIKCIGDDIYFCSNEKIFHYKNNQKLSTLSPEKDKAFHTYFKVGKHLFVREKNTGVCILINNKLEVLPGSEIFKDPSNRINFILPINETQYLIGSNKLGTFILNYNAGKPLQSSIIKQSTAMDSWFIEQQLYCAEKINDNLFAFGSLKDGLILTDKALNPIKKINFKNGLQDDAVKHIYSDFNCNLWLSLNLGITFVEVNTPITHWTKQDGIKGTVESVLKYDGIVYIANDKGIQTLDSESNSFTQTSVIAPTWNLIECNHNLLAATDEGLVTLKNNKTSLLFEEGPYLIYKYPYDKTTLFLGLSDAMVIGKYENNVFTEIKRYEGWSDVKWAASCKDEYVAFGTTNNGVYLLNPKNNNIIKNLDTINGLPSMTENNVFNYNNKVYIGTDKGIYKIQKTPSWRCEKASEFISADINRPVTKAKQLGNDVWVQISRSDNSELKRNELSIFSPNQNNFIENQKLLKRIKGIDSKDFFLDKNQIYIGTNDGLFCYNLLSAPKKSNFNTFASYIINKNDTIFENLTPHDQLKPIAIDYKENEISIIPGSADFFDKNEIVFSWYLEGQDETYNTWQKTNLISFSNLHEGSYTIHLKSMNILGQEGEPIHISFTVNTPWYRSTWAYVIYVLISGLLIWLIVYLNSKRLKAANLLLEKTVNDRTLEVQQEKQIVEEQKHLIEEKHKEITDSINYAERIQRTFLATKELLDENLKEHFVYFKPKDVVSGDFYWGEKLNNGNFALVTADSTGHGVPGAIMSLLNITSLETAIKKGIIEPSEILNLTRKTIIDRLKKDGSTEGGKDGMDCSFAIFDFKNKKITYAAANNPIWIIRNNSFTSLKADRMSVGKHDKDSIPFNQFEFDLQSGDMIYTFTDGFPDQFGGPKGKKFKYKQLEELLISISNESMEIQKNKLNEAFENWKGSLEQIDDVCIIGVRFN